MRLCCLALLLPLTGLGVTSALAAPAAAPAAAADAPTAIAVGPATPAPTPSVTSALTLTLGTTGDFERKSVTYGCTGDATSLTVDFINAPPNYLALVPIEGTTLLFNTVLSGSGVRYAAGKYLFWTKGNEASLYDQTQGENAKPILSCAEVNETP